MANTGVGFGAALDLLKSGEKMGRAGWVEHGKFIVYQKGYPKGIPCNSQTADAWGLKIGEKFICNPYLQIRNQDGSHSMYSPTSDDVLAEDWVIYMSKDEAKQAGII